MSVDQQIVLGVDGGGTKTEAWLARASPGQDEQIIGRGQAASSNVKAVGTQAALTNLQQAVEQAWSDAKQPPRPVSLAVFALSGAGRPETQLLVEEWALRNKIADCAQVVHDALPVLVAGTKDGCGVALIAGTGAVAFAANVHMQTAVVGGWGFWFGDEGSAFWIGQAAARAVSHAADGRSTPTLLTKAILDRLAINEPREILSALSRAGDVRTGLAGLAELVVDCAEQQDPTARHIVNDAAGHLASLVISAAKHVDLATDTPLALAGGVLTGSTLLREALQKELATRMLRPGKIEIVMNPVLGCIRLATRGGI